MSNQKSQRDLRIVIIGAGMSGILSAIRLQEEGLDNFIIYEKAASLGGTWRDNRYPGLSCDVPSHVYSYSFEPNPDWSHKFSPGPEILEYFTHVAEKYGVVPRISFNSEITACAFRDGRWHIGMADGRSDVADVVLCATGILHHPKMPDIEGLESFAGAAFHSARWPENLSLKGKKVGIIGTGSTAIQIVNAVVDEVGELNLFQRTAQWVLPEPNPAYSENDRARFREDPDMLRHMRRRMSESITEIFSNALIDAGSNAMQAIEDTCRRNLEENVRDPGLRRKLTPDYRAGCKRLIMADGFYDSLQRPNANVITERIERIEPAGVRTADGVLHDLDVLVLATGFNAHQFMRPMNVTGREGVSLNELWEDSVYAYRSISVPGFPNFFILMGPQSPVGNFSLIDVAEMQFDYVLQLVNLLREGRCATVEATEEATRRFTNDVIAAMKDTIWVTGCASWYLDEHGVPITWPWTLTDFQEAMRAPALEDYALAG